MLDVRINSAENGYRIYDVAHDKSYVAVSLEGFSGPSVARVLRSIEDDYKATPEHQDTTDTAE